MTTILKASTSALVLGVSLLATPMAAAQIPMPGDMGDMSQYMPSKEEMRKSLVEAGMTPAQIENILSSMKFPDAAPHTADKPIEPPACLDENANEICDDEENDPEIRTCWTNNINVIEKYARDLYRRELGDNAIEVAQTCATAGIGGSMYYGTRPGSVAASQGTQAWYTDMDKADVIVGYWEKVMAYGRYIYGRENVMPKDMPEYGSPEFNLIVSELPADLRSMMLPGDNPSGNFYERAEPVHAKCEKLRRRVGVAYRAEVKDQTVCLAQIPPAEE